MRNLIVYTTTHGCTEKCADEVKEGLTGETTVINIKKESAPDLQAFDTIILGGSIHAGKIQKRIKKFCEKQLDLLLTKKVGLFICCMEDGENAEKQLAEAYPAALRDHATAKGLFGGEFDFDKMKGIEKAIIKKVAQIEESVSKISDENIRSFIDAMNA